MSGRQDLGLTLDRLGDIEWRTDDSPLLLNPRISEPDRIALEKAWREVGIGAFAGCLGVATSGSRSTGPGSIVALSRAAVLASARGVNAHLQSDPRDVWYKAVPSFHVAGIGIYARAALSGASIVEAPSTNKWSAAEFARAVDAAGATLASLVPTQVVDLVREAVTAPRGLRAVLVGGGALEAEAYQRARALGWPLLPSFGMSECASTIAAANLESLRVSAFPRLELLGHVEARVDDVGQLSLRSAAVFSGRVRVAVDSVSIETVASGSWHQTDDLARLDGRWLEPLGRGSDFLKIGGEATSLARLEAILERAKVRSVREADVALVALADDRLGQSIHFIYSESDRDAALEILKLYEADVLPFERPRSVTPCDRVPRSALGKVLRERAIEIVRSAKAAARE